MLGSFAVLLIKIIIIIFALTVVAAYLTFAERKVLGYMQGRIGPNRVGFFGWAQPIADTIKLLFKEVIIPTGANRFLFIIAPILAVVPALVIWAVIPAGKNLVLADINAGILFVLAMGSIGVFGIIIGGWASNSRYGLTGALREGAQVISYEIPLGFALAGVTLAAGSLNLQKIVLQQSGGIWHWFWLPLLPLFAVYWFSGIAQTNRLPFDTAEAESELVAGFHVEYSGIMFALFFLAEYINMVSISALAVLFFFGGWMSPFDGIPMVAGLFNWVPGIVWFLGKLSVFMFFYFWLRATLPRFRYDQIMNICWKIFIPITLIWIVIEGFAIQLWK